MQLIKLCLTICLIMACHTLANHVPDDDDDDVSYAPNESRVESHFRPPSGPRLKKKKIKKYHKTLYHEPSKLPAIQEDIVYQNDNHYDMVSLPVSGCVGDMECTAQEEKDSIREDSSLEFSCRRFASQTGVGGVENCKGCVATLGNNLAEGVQHDDIVEYRCAYVTDRSGEEVCERRTDEHRRVELVRKAHSSLNADDYYIFNLWAKQGKAIDDKSCVAYFTHEETPLKDDLKVINDQEMPWFSSFDTQSNQKNPYFLSWKKDLPVMKTPKYSLKQKLGFSLPSLRNNARYHKHENDDSREENPEIPSTTQKTMNGEKYSRLDDKYDEDRNQKPGVESYAPGQTKRYGYI